MKKTENKTTNLLIPGKFSTCIYADIYKDEYGSASYVICRKYNSEQTDRNFFMYYCIGGNVCDR